MLDAFAVGAIVSYTKPLFPSFVKSKRYVAKDSDTWGFFASPEDLDYLALRKDNHSKPYPAREKLLTWFG